MDEDNNLDTRVISQIITGVASTVIAAGVTVILVVDSMYNIPKEPRINREKEREDYINSIIHGSDSHCIDQIRMSPRAFYRLCEVLKNKNLLRPTINVSIEEQVDCIGAIDGTHVRASVPIALQARPNGLRVPEGKYLLGDTGYGLRNGFIPPYRGVRYHLKEYSNHSPENEKELFNLRHSSLQTTVERAFGVLKKRFRVLDAEPYWSYKTQVDIILACCVLHNHIMGVDPTDNITRDVERELQSETQGTQLIRRTQREEREENREWAIKRDAIANAMYNDYINRGNMLRLSANSSSVVKTILSAYFVVLPLRDEGAISLGLTNLPGLFLGSLALTLVAAPVSTVIFSLPNLSKGKTLTFELETLESSNRGEGNDVGGERGGSLVVVAAEIDGENDGGDYSGDAQWR
ncbi:hypothetical protein HHK36_001463 [Tetracentron sinense]|uniref:DDE Tnp4 domain-containing protein n=1 Tax=Tetracentron sinense TaxID=13715 RepID=A0A835DRN7_TETSI|nr:hypothetical protein HHK36_001463 [Tetracentron sinense]